MNAGGNPISPPSNGTISASSARLGTVCTTPANPKVHWVIFAPAAGRDAQRKADRQPHGQRTERKQHMPAQVRGQVVKEFGQLLVHD